MKIPAVQSGLFKDVRGCMDAAALLVVTPPEGRTPIVITSLNAVDSATGQRSVSAGSAPLNTEGADEAALRGCDRRRDGCGRQCVCHRQCGRKAQRSVV